MRSTFRIFCYINKQKVKADGTTTILCRISIDGKQTVLTTGIHCRVEDWNAKKGEVKAEILNNRLIKFKERIENTYEYILKEQGVVSSELLKNTIVGINTTPKNLLQAGEIEIERLRLRAIEISSNSTYRESRLTQLNLKEFLESRGLKDIAFTAIREEFGESFKTYLKVVGERKSSYINRCLTWLNRLIYIAIDQEVLRANPLEDVRYEKKDPPKHRFVSRQDLKRIIETPMSSSMMELVRRAFIFSSFTALAYVDVKGLYPRHIGKTADGQAYLRIRRKKTDVEAFIPLHPIAIQILELYNTTDDSKPVFPLPVRDRIWLDINQIGIVLGFKENLSYHQSRHSFGTLAISAGLSIESIAKMMGHANISTTQTYAQITEQKISEDMDKLIKRRKETSRTKNS
ncbi:site-specific integrase [Dysgonomonas sp. Marseille-P4361]|uniref:site-specific integrase n=1 Tax=Dysgonomonas sp. Marseille-P4361 TaxID=2161820 RepID=UPI000D55376F|nr:site-specific integrase [Dysgonomonas sp. Marseille-P4361]